MQSRLEYLIKIDALIKQSKQRADERYNSAAKLFKEGFCFEARIMLYQQMISLTAHLRLKSYLKNKLTQLANEL